MTDHPDERSPARPRTARQDNPESPPVLVEELVASIRTDARQHTLQAMEQLDPELTAWHCAAANRASKAADTLVAQQREIEGLRAELEEAKDDLGAADGLIAAVLTWGRERALFDRHDYPDGIAPDEIADELNRHERGCIERAESRAEKAESERDALKAEREELRVAQGWHENLDGFTVSTIIRGYLRARETEAQLSAANARAEALDAALKLAIRCIVKDEPATAQGVLERAITEGEGRGHG